MFKSIGIWTPKQIRLADKQLIETGQDSAIIVVACAI
jgi:hypothetical protein